MPVGATLKATAYKSGMADSGVAEMGAGKEGNDQREYLSPLVQDVEFIGDRHA